MDLSIQLAASGNSVAGSVLNADTSHFTGNPNFTAAIVGSTNGITPTFKIESEPFDEVFRGQQVTRSFLIEGELLKDGRLLRGIYTETIQGYTHDPLLLSGSVLLFTNAVREPTTVTLSVSKSQLAFGESAQLTVQVLDQSGHPMQGELVSLFGSLGTVSPDNAITDVNGEVSAEYTAGINEGDATLQALVRSTNGSAVIHIVRPENTTHSNGYTNRNPQRNSNNDTHADYDANCHRYTDRHRDTTGLRDLSAVYHAVISLQCYVGTRPM